MEEIEKIIDIKKAARESNSRFFRSLPLFMLRLIERIICQDEINHTIHRSRHLTGGRFICDVLEKWNVTVKVNCSENIPSSGRFIFAANHPVGGMDALAIISMIHNHFPDMFTLGNRLLDLIPNIRSLVVPVDAFGHASRDSVLEVDRMYASDAQIMIFPAGEVSRRRNGLISDIPWQKSFISKAVQHRRDIIPVHISGRNSGLFYNVATLRKMAGIKMYVETVLLPREMINQRGGVVTLTVGRPIPWQFFTRDRTADEWAGYVKSIVYSLPDQNKISS